MEYQSPVSVTTEEEQKFYARETETGRLQRTRGEEGNASENGQRNDRVILNVDSVQEC